MDYLITNWEELKMTEKKYLQTKNTGVIPIDDNMIILSIREVYLCYDDGKKRVKNAIETDKYGKHVTGSKLIISTPEAVVKYQEIDLIGLSQEEIIEIYDKECPLHKNKLNVRIMAYVEYYVQVEDMVADGPFKFSGMTSRWYLRKYKNIDGYILSPCNIYTYHGVNPNDINGTFAQNMFIELPDIEEFGEDNLINGIKKNGVTVIVESNIYTALNSNIIKKLIDNGYMVSYGDENHYKLTMDISVPYDVRREVMVKMIRNDNDSKVYIVLSDNNDMYNIASIFRKEGSDTKKGSGIFYNLAGDENDNKYDTCIKYIMGELYKKLELK